MTYWDKAKDLIDWGRRVQFLYACAALVFSGGSTALVRAIFGAEIPTIWRLPTYLISFSLILFLLAILINWIAGRKNSTARSGGQWSAEASLEINKPSAAFDIATFMNKGYSSQLQPEVEKTVTGWLHTVPQKEREAAFTRFIASGLIAYMHDTSWWLMFKSQFMALDELNKNVLRKEDLKALFYDKAAELHPEEYKSDTFDRWLAFLRDRVLIIDLPGEIIGITERGKDFLKHTIHYGYSIKGRRL